MVHGIYYLPCTNKMIHLGKNDLVVLYDYHVILADETPVLVTKDARDAGPKC